MMPPARGLLKRGQRRLLDHAASRAHHDELVFLELLDRQRRRDFLAWFHRDEIRDRLALAVRADVGNFVHLQPVRPAAVGEDHDVGVRRGDEEVADEIFVARAHADAPLAAAALIPVGGDRRPFDIAGVADGNGHILFGDQRLDAQLARLAFDNLGAAIVAVLLAYGFELVDDDLHQQPFARENGAEPLDSS